MSHAASHTRSSNAELFALHARPGMVGLAGGSAWGGSYDPSRTNPVAPRKQLLVTCVYLQRHAHRRGALGARIGSGNSPQADSFGGAGKPRRQILRRTRTAERRLT